MSPYGPWNKFVKYSTLLSRLRFNRPSIDRPIELFDFEFQLLVLGCCVLFPRRSSVKYYNLTESLIRIVFQFKEKKKKKKKNETKKKQKLLLEC